MMWKLILLVCIFEGARAQAACPNGWIHHEDSCYLLHDHDRYDWMEAKGYCDLHNAHLASVQGNIENIFIKGLITQSRISQVVDPHLGVWLGATDDVVEGSFVWYDTQSPLTFTDWGPGEPDGGRLNIAQDCLLYWAAFSWKWGDYDCSQKAFYICEKGWPSRFPLRLCDDRKIIILHEDYFEIRKRKEYVGYLYYARSVVPLMAALQLLWLQTSH